MARSSDPNYNPAKQSLPIPDSDVGEVQPIPMIDWAAPVPGDPSALVDSLLGDSVPPGQAFTRVVSPSGQMDVTDEGV